MFALRNEGRGGLGSRSVIGLITKGGGVCATEGKGGAVSDSRSVIRLIIEGGGVYALLIKRGGRTMPIGIVRVISVITSINHNFPPTGLTEHKILLLYFRQHNYIIGLNFRV